MPSGFKKMLLEFLYIEKVKFYIMHRRLCDTTGKLLEITSRYIQMELGTSTPFWDIPFKKYGYLVSATWTSHIWDYLSQCNVRLHDENQWTYTPPRTNDSHLMDIVLDTLLDKY